MDLAIDKDKQGGQIHSSNPEGQRNRSGVLQRNLLDTKANRVRKNSLVANVVNKRTKKNIAKLRMHVKMKSLVSKTFNPVMPYCRY